MPNIFPFPTCRFSTILLKDFLKTGFEIITDDVERPARLNVLLGAIQVIVFSAIFSESDAKEYDVNPAEQDRNGFHRKGSEYCF